MHKELEFLEYMVKSIVIQEDKVSIERIEDELGILLTLQVDKSDMWIIIGKWGNTINSLRTLLRILWVKMGKKINVKVLD